MLLFHNYTPLSTYSELCDHIINEHNSTDVNTRVSITIVVKNQLLRFLNKRVNENEEMTKRFYVHGKFKV